MTTVQRERAWTLIEITALVLVARTLKAIFDHRPEWEVQPVFEYVYYWCFLFLGPAIGIGCATATIDRKAPLLVAFGNAVVAGVLAMQLAALLWLMSAFGIYFAYRDHVAGMVTASGVVTGLSALPGLLGGVLIACHLRRDFQPPTYTTLLQGSVVAIVLGVPELVCFVLLFAGGPN